MSNGYSAETNPVQAGLGVRAGSIDNNMAAGGVETTGNATDVNIQGNGWLRVADGNASSTPPAFDTTEYTRAGDLTSISPATSTTQTGQYVLGDGATLNATKLRSQRPTNNPIIVPPGSSDVTVGADGSVNYENSTGTMVTAGYISLATFPNQAGLQRDGGSLWSSTTASGARRSASPVPARSGRPSAASSSSPTSTWAPSSPT